jgi:thiamine monophosphate synthase
LYTPDLKVIRRSKRQIIEVKDKKSSEKEEFIELKKRVAPICEAKGYQFVVVTDVEIRVQPKLENIKIMYKYAKTVVTSEHQIILNSLFLGRESLTLEEIMVVFALKGIPNSVVYALIYHGILSVDLMLPIGMASVAHLSLPLSSQRRITA